LQLNGRAALQPSDDYRQWTDLQIFELCARKKWCLLTYNTKQLKVFAEAKAISEMGLRVVMVTDGVQHLVLWEQVRWFVNNWDEIITVVELMSPGTVAIFQKNGSHRIQSAADAAVQGVLKEKEL